MKRIIIMVSLVAVALSVGVYAAFNVLPFLFVSKDKIINDANCKDEQVAFKEMINGRLQKKYRDKENHLWKTIEYSSVAGSARSLIFLNDRSGAYDFILPGDSIVKEKNSVQLKIIREGTVQIYQLNYGCQQNDKTDL